MIAVVSDDATCLYPPDHIHDCWGNCAVDIDCTGLCDGNNEEDACGVCGGDSSTCVGCMDTNSCNFDEHASIPDITLCFYETVLLSCMGVCKHDVDCGGNCDGYLTVDACGVCNGDSTLCVGCTNPAACNYEATATIDDGSCTYSATCNTVCTTDVDCAGTCDGSLVVDECEVCGGFGASCTDGAYCAAGTVDCKGECDGGREFDACGICDGDTSTCIGCNDEDACNYLESASIGIPSMCTYPDWDGVDCSGNCVVGFDCKGHCGGDRVIDVCGVCGGFGASCTENYCDGGIIDCAGECGGGRKIDNCGVCDGNNEACTVEDFCAYGTVDCFGICHCPFTTSDPELCARPILDLPAPSVCSLFNDGSFEGLTTTKTYEDVSSLGSWTPSGPLYLAASEAAFWGGLAATDAGYFLVMQGDSYINQTLHATHWKYYSLTFDAAARPDYGMDTLYVNVDGTRIYSLVVPDVEEFQPHRVLFQAESSLVTLQIFHEADAVTGDPDAAVFIDNVEVSLSSQVLLDGSFEGLSTTTTYESTSYLGSWTGEGVLIATGSSAWGGLDAPSGYHYFAEQGDGWLSQYVPTVVGATYALTFYAAARPGYGMETLYVYVDSEVAHTLELVDEDETGVIGFERFSLNFYATNALTKLEFHHRVQSGDLTLFLDAVAVAPTSDLMLDGSFEGVSTVTEYEDTTNPGSWKGDTTIVRTGDDTHGGILTPAGNYYAVLGATQKITQTVPTTTGSSYAISFIVSCAPSYGMDKMYVIINGLTVYRLVVEDSLSWAEHTLNFVAEDESSIISFYHGPSAIQSANTAVYIDKIQIALTDDIVVDGGFEGISTTTEYEYTEDYLDMWTGSGVIIFSGNEEWGGLEAPEGLYYVGRQGAGIIEQNLTTVPDQHYELSFKTAARPDYGADVLHVVLHGAIVYQLKLEDTGEFMEHKLNYQAQSELTLVTFQHVIEADGNLTVLLDEVTAEPTQDIVLDGSFEGLALTTAYHDVSSVDSTTGHWAGDGTIVRSGNSHFGDLEAPAGDYYFVLPSGSSISQTLQTTVGKHYTVSFYAAPRPDYGAEPLTVHIRNEIVYTLELADDKEFEQHYINFYANTSTTLLEFQQTEDDDTHAILLDEIKITESENLVIDGSFEGISTTLAYEYMPEGAVGAWQDSGDTSFHVIVKSENSIWGGLAAPSGDYYIALQQDTIIAQTFHTTKGDFYVLSFAVASRPSVGMDTLLLYVDGELSHTIVGADGEFVEMNFLFAASSDTMNIRFVHVDSADADKSVFLDDVTFMLYDESSVMDDHLVSC